MLNECAVNRLLSVCSNYASLCCDKNDHYDDDENSIGYFSSTTTKGTLDLYPLLSYFISLL